MLVQIEVVTCDDEVNGMYVIHDSMIIGGSMTIVWREEGRAGEIPWIDEEWIHSGEHHSVVYRAATKGEEGFIKHHLGKEAT